MSSKNVLNLKVVTNGYELMGNAQRIERKKQTLGYVLMEYWSDLDFGFRIAEFGFN